MKMKTQKKHYKNIEKELTFIETFIDRMIPFLVIIIAIMLVLNLTIDVHVFEPWFSFLDWFIIVFFVADLIFKWIHIRKFSKFVRLYWLEILAVFPFYLIIRAYSAIIELVIAGERISVAQQVTHEALLLREARLLREAELAGREAKFIPRIIRGVQGFLRLLWGSLHIVTEHLLHVSRKSKKIRTKRICQESQSNK